MIDVADNDKIYWYHYDGLGSVVALSKDNGEVVERYTYTAFGGVTIRDANDAIRDKSTVGNPYMFTARRLDEETGLYYYRYRYYSPETGRFMSTDPLGLEAGLNLYAYVGNNGVNWVDPWGLAPNNNEAASRRLLQQALRQYAKNHPGLSNRALVAGLAGYMKANGYNLYGVRYFNTYNGKTFDLLHFAAAAQYAQSYGEGAANVLGWLNEVGQAIRGDPSGAPFGGNEDLASNAAGADYVDDCLSDAMDFVKSIINYFRDKNSGITEERPDYGIDSEEGSDSSSSN